MTGLLTTSAQPLLATHRGEEAAAVLRAFPPRVRAASWPQTEATREEVLDRLRKPPLRYTIKSSQDQRMCGARLLLDWLRTLPGDTWQQRWDSSPAAVSYDGWYQIPWAWAAAQGRPTSRTWSDTGLLALICADVVRPSMQWLAGNPSRHIRHAVATIRDPDGFARLAADVPEQERTTQIGSRAVKCIAQIVVAYGGSVDDIVVGDLLAHPKNHASGSQAVRIAYTWLRDRGQFPSNAPATLHNLTARTGQISPAGLIDRYQLHSRRVRDLLVEYLTERQPTLDYTSLKIMASHLAGLFWSDLEHHHPGIESLRLPPAVSDLWKARVAVKTIRRRRPDGTIGTVTEPRQNAVGVKQSVRSFYLDLAQWALDDPVRWGEWAAPCPISEAECVTKKRDQQQKSRSDQRTRERMPVLPVLVRTAERRLAEARERLDAIDAAPLGSTVTVHGVTFTLSSTTQRIDGRPETVYDASGALRYPRREEKRAFFAWATIEILRHTGIRVEELLELSHYSIVRYNLPTTGETVPLLQIAPSKTDRERMLLVSPELADVLSAIVSRVRRPDGVIPSIRTYDNHERTWNDPMPVLFQWAVSGEARRISINTIRRALKETLDESGLVDRTGAPLDFAPRDFRRIFITDAILNGLPPHIAQVIAGHDSLNTTMGYAAIYPADAIEAHRAFIARRRASRPAEEYRAVTPEEWDEFLSHFERRKLALGECGRAYGTDCSHEHACVRCPVLIVNPAERPRLDEIRNNLHDRIVEAEREGWLGEAEGLRVSLAAAEEKLAQLDAQRSRHESPVFLGIPGLNRIAGRASA